MGVTRVLQATGTAPPVSHRRKAIVAGLPPMATSLKRRLPDDGMESRPVASPDRLAVPWPPPKGTPTVAREAASAAAESGSP